MSHLVETDVLIVGTGPAGASAAAMLATLGVKHIVISKFGWTARTPRSHITNQRTMEILRDLGLEKEVIAQAAPNTLMGENTYCTSLAGSEIGRLRTWGTQPHRLADYEQASPTRFCDFPQNLLEPLLVSSAARWGSKVRFDTEYVSLTQDASGVTVTVRDHLTGTEYPIRAKYVIGADGANSKVVRDVGLPLEGKMGVSGSMNIVFEADLTAYVAHRPSVLYWVIQPGSSVGGLGIGVVRMVRPWHRWLAIWGYDVAVGPPEVTPELAKQIVHNLIGDATVPVTIDAVSTWTVNDMYARQVAQGRVFCAGDAVHRHPPTNGLGSNASIQDAYNLCWKLAMVLRGAAAPSLLDSYDAERAPVAAKVVKRANKSLECFPPILNALGLFDTKDPEQMKRNMAALQESTPKAAAQRAQLRQAIDMSDYVYNCHGVEMNDRYESNAVVPDGSAAEEFVRDAELYHQPSSRPGAHLPHAWLSRAGHAVSTIDACRYDGFTVLTGVGGEAWELAARAASEVYGIDVRTHVIGPGRTYEDPYGDFARLRGCSETGALLVRPDRFVAWRCEAAGASATDQLVDALGRILGRRPASTRAIKAAV